MTQQRSAEIELCAHDLRGLITVCIRIKLVGSLTFTSRTYSFI